MVPTKLQHSHPPHKHPSTLHVYCIVSNCCFLPFVHEYTFSINFLPLRKFQKKPLGLGFHFFSCSYLVSQLTKSKIVVTTLYLLYTLVGEFLNNSISINFVFSFTSTSIGCTLISCWSCFVQDIFHQLLKLVLNSCTAFFLVILIFIMDSNAIF